MEVKTSDKYQLYLIAARVGLAVVCGLDTDGTPGH
jgi:hypothetical protein